MAGIWLSVLIGGALLVFTFVALIGSAMGGSSVKVEDQSVLRITLSGEIVDRASDMSLNEVLQSQGEMPLSLTDIVDAVTAAKTDDRIEGILLECSGIGAGMAQCDEILAALRDFKSSKKWIVAYSDNYSQADYFIASAADSLLVNTVGMIDIHGLGSTTLYFKDLLDKVGVDAQVVRVGTYKSAVEPFLLSDMSEANREQITGFLGRIWDNMAGTIAKNRGVHIDSVNAWANSFEFSLPTESYVSSGVATGMIYRRQLDDMIAALTATDEPKYIDLEDYVAAAGVRPSGKGEKTVAVLYALGDITESSEGGIASDRLVPQILELAENKDIDALVLRVNSGGGSAFASEQIWEALEQYKAVSGKPFYVSMGDYAASGGYYISCGADKIFASPLTLTGSIGIFGVIPNIQPLLKEKLGVNPVSINTNEGSMPTFMAPMTAEQRDAMQSYVNRGYELFVGRVASSRGLSVDSVKEIAQGRVWDGLSAFECGLVDEIGGLRACLDAMAKELGCKYDELNIQRYPDVQDQWWMPLLAAGGQQMYAMLASPMPEGTEEYMKMLRSIATMYPLQARANYITLY